MSIARIPTSLAISVEAVAKDSMKTAREEREREWKNEDGKESKQ